MFPYLNSYSYNTQPLPINTPGYWNGQFVGNPSPNFGWNTPQPLNYNPWPVNTIYGTPFMGDNGFNGVNNFNSPAIPTIPTIPAIPAGFSPWNTPQLPQVSPTNAFVPGWNWNYAPAGQNWAPNSGQPQPTTNTFVGQPVQIPSPPGNVPWNQGWVPSVPFGFVPTNFTGAPTQQTPPAPGNSTNSHPTHASSNGQPPVGIQQAA